MRALYQLDRQYERALQRCTEALGDGETSEVYSNRGSAYLMIDEIDRAISPNVLPGTFLPSHARLITASPSTTYTTEVGAVGGLAVGMLVGGCDRQPTYLIRWQAGH